jgi:membrane protein
MAYRFLFALFPFLIFLAAFLGFIGSLVGSEDLFADVMEIFAVIAPPEIYRLLNDWVASVVRSSSTGLLTFGAAGALYGAAGGVATLMKGLNRAYDVEETRPFWLVQGLALATTLALALLTLSGVVFFTFGSWLGAWLATTLRLGDGFVAIWDFARGPGIVVGFSLVLVALYAALPNLRVGVLHAIPGAIVAMLGWVVLTVGFSFYLSNFGSYELTFGSLGAAVVLMVWMNAVGLILLLGGEINAVLAAGRARSAQTTAPQAFDAEEGMERLLAEFEQNRSTG